MANSEVVVSSLEHILLNTYNPDTSLRSQAEASLAQYLCQPGSLHSMLMFLGNPDHVHRDLRQAAGIAVKNKLKSKIFYHHHYRLYYYHNTIRVLVNRG